MYSDSGGTFGFFQELSSLMVVIILFFSYFIFRLTVLFPSAIVDHYIAHINRIYIFLTNLGEIRE